MHTHEEGAERNWEINDCGDSQSTKYRYTHLIQNSLNEKRS